jgi:GNAT superfamily N-acetyltransferase
VRHTISIDGQERAIDIRAMGEEFIVYCKMFEAPLTPQNVRNPEPDEPAYVVQEFFRKQIQIVGSCMVLACDGDGVVGKMHFTTREMHEAIGGPENWDAPHCYCVDHPGFAPKIQTLREDELQRLLASESRTLRVLCFNVGHTDPRWHGLGIATAMVEYLKQWAREHGWRRIETKSCPDITPTTIIGDWMLRRGPLERRAFRVVEETQVLPPEASRRLEEIEAFLSGSKEVPQWGGWYAENVQRLSSDPAWRSEYDKEYLMACKL